MALMLATAIPALSPLRYALGSNLVTGGDFASATGWTLGTGWAIASGVATVTPPGATSLLTWATALTTGRLYLVEFQITSFTAGLLSVRFTNAGAPVGASIGLFSAAGTYAVYAPLDVAADGLSFVANSTASLSIDNASLRIVL